MSDTTLLAAIRHGEVVIEPFNPDLVQPASVDVHLGDRFRVFTGHNATHIDPRRQDDTLTRPVQVLPTEPFVLHPGEFVLGCTVERFQIGVSTAARLEGKSSLGRLGLLVHSTAGFIDPGFHGVITLELSNVNTLPILLWPGMLIGQLCCMELTQPAERPYGSPGLRSRYQHQDGPAASRSWMRHPPAATSPETTGACRTTTAPAAAARTPPG